MFVHHLLSIVSLTWQQVCPILSALSSIAGLIGLVGKFARRFTE